MANKTIVENITIAPSEHNLFITVKVLETQFHHDILSLKGNILDRTPIKMKDLGKLSNLDGIRFKLRSEVSHTNADASKSAVIVTLTENGNEVDYTFSYPSSPGDIIEFVIYLRITNKP